MNGVSGNVGVDVVGTYGTLHLNAYGTYSYTLNNAQALAEGQTVTDVFSYTDSDNHGGSSSASLTITVTGTNDAPIAVADVNAVKEDTAPNPVSGNVLTNDTDVDLTDTHSVTAVNGVSGNVGVDVVGTYGTLSRRPWCRTGCCPCQSGMSVTILHWTAVGCCRMTAGLPL